MLIKDVSKLYNISPDTLRYYEKIGVIPKVNRNKSGIRDYGEEDLKWVENAICLRNAGLSVEILIEYVKLFQEGEKTLENRCQLLERARAEIVENKKKYEIALERLEYKIEIYKKGIETGILLWE